MTWEIGDIAVCVERGFFSKVSPHPSTRTCPVTTGQSYVVADVASVLSMTLKYYMADDNPVVLWRHPHRTFEVLRLAGVQWPIPELWEDHGNWFPAIWFRKGEPLVDRDLERCEGVRLYRAPRTPVIAAPTRERIYRGDPVYVDKDGNVKPVKK